MKKTYNVGIIGTGFMGKVHSYSYENLKYYYPDSPFKVKLFGVCSRRKEVVDKLKNDYSFATTDYKELINHPEIDIVDICTQNQFHKEQILEAIKADKHIYCEKPLVSDIKDSEAILRALENFKKTHQITFNSRFTPTSIRVKELIDLGKLGDPISFNIAYYHSGSIEKDKPMGWKQEKGAGVSLDLASHIVDLLYYFWGEFSEVSAITKILYPERINKEGKVVKVEAEDYFNCNIKLKNGAVGNLVASKIALGSEDEIRYELFGTKGAIQFNSMQPNFILFFDKNDPQEGFKTIPVVSRYPESNFPGPKFAVGWIRGHIHAIYKFVSSVDSNQQANPSFYDGHYNMKVLEASRLSEKNGEWVKVD